MNEKSVTDYWKDGFVKIFKYSGRASRKEFLSIALLNIIVGIFLSPLDKANVIENASVGASLLLLLVGFFGVAVYLTQISAQCRRLHDLGISGLWMGFGYLLIILSMVFLVIANPSEGDTGVFVTYLLIFGAGGLLLFVLFLIGCFKPTGKFDNQYGPSLRKN